MKFEPSINSTEYAKETWPSDINMICPLDVLVCEPPAQKSILASPMDNKNLQPCTKSEGTPPTIDVE
jgi:hypothetical protein